MQPSSQQNRPISFLLFDNGETDRFVAWQDLIIRPEEMTRNDPSRLNVTQTLGGAWLDDFGPGISSITLSGHTGWRGSQSQDGAEIFKQLRDTVFVEWNRRRSNRPNDASPPDDVQLVLADQLNGFAVVVAPQSFQLRRHKSRPLLSTFNISLLVLKAMDVADFVTTQDFIRDAITAPGRTALARVALEENQRKQQEAMAALQKSGASKALVGASKALLDKSAALLTQVNKFATDIKGEINSFTAPIMAVSENVLGASKNAFQILAMPSNLAQDVKHNLQNIASNFMDAYCNLRNGFERLMDFPDFSDLFGASTCSSTGGGRPISPWAATNPFAQIYASGAAPVTVSASAVGAFPVLKQDPLSTDLAEADVIARLNDISAGVTVAANVVARLSAIAQRKVGVKTADTRHGDTLQQIALRELCDASKWPEIALMNGLKPPYLTNDPAMVSDTVMLTGARMLIPAAAPVATADVTVNDPFGTDVKLSRGRLVVADGNIDLVSGVDNLDQALGHVVVTEPGELIFHPRYGCGIRQFLGASNSRANALVSGALVKQALAADPRVSRVASATVEISGAVHRIEATAVAVDGSTVGVTT